MKVFRALFSIHAVDSLHHPQPVALSLVVICPYSVCLHRLPAVSIPHLPSTHACIMDIRPRDDDSHETCMSLFISCVLRSHLLISCRTSRLIIYKLSMRVCRLHTSQVANRIQVERYWYLRRGMTEGSRGSDDLPSIKCKRRCCSQ